MARMHSRKKGKSRSKKPNIKISPEWVKHNPKEIESIIVKLSKEGHPPAMIGLILRDQYGVPDVKLICKKTITQILKSKGIKFDIPEDLLNLIKRAVRMRRHLDDNTRDIHNRIKLVHVESKIRRLAKYYVKKGYLPKSWRYSPKTAALLIK
ncbi:30S ribosomal protein S15 [Candidatus Micrarchaeota archaeon]|nr:30S ribosomal protein S15 [Candidatus Micrarchaeota archaeon]